MKLAIITAACSLAIVTILLPCQSAAQTNTDIFTDSANWGTPLGDSGKNLTVANGRMNFTSITTAGGGAGIARTTPSLTITQNWSIKIDVHIDPFVITNEAQGVSVFLGIGKSTDYLGTHVLLGFERDFWETNTFGVNDDVQVNGVSAPGLFNLNDLASSDVTLRLDYSATEHTITYYIDSDGSLGGSGWTQLGSADISSGTYNLQLSPADTLVVVLGGYSDLQAVTAGQAYFDNLEITLSPNDYAPTSIAGLTVLGVITNTDGVAMYAVVTNIYDVATFSLLGPGADYTYSGNYTYVKTGPNSGTIYTVKTSPPEQAGETGTNYLTFTSLTNGLFVYNWPPGGGGYGTQLGTFQVLTTVNVGSLQVTISPSEAISAGAQWQVDGGALHDSGASANSLAVGNHTVSYITISGWDAPSNQSITVSAGVTSVTNGIYTPQTGSLQVTIAPPNAVSAGAQWQVDGGVLQDSGATANSLAVGSHTVSYKTISGWNTPSNQTVIVAANLTTVTNATYILQTGALIVTITPSEAITAGAQWQVDGGSWQNSGVVVSGLTSGNHMVSYKTIPDWITPINEMVVVSPGSTTTANGNYVTPGLPAPPPTINCMLQGGTFTMTYPTVADQVYILQYTDDLNPPVTWHSFLPFASFASPISISIPTGGTPTRYFRVRVGDSLFTAVYSVNVVGYVRRTIQPGLNLVANPLNSCGGNSIGNLFQNCPANSQILLPAPNGSLTPGSVFSGGSWDSPNLNLSPGQGVGFGNPGAAFEVTFAGEVAAGSLTTPLSSGLSLVSSVMPVNGLLNFPAQEGNQITTWDATNQTSVNHQYLGGAWQPSPPAISPGEAFWVQVSQSTQWTQPFEWWNDLEAWELPIITREPQSQTRIPGTTAQFTAFALGNLPLSYRWRKDGTNLLNTERIFGVTSSTLALTNAQPGDAGNYTVVITNSFGSVTSQVAVLTVSLPPPEIITTNGSFGISNGVFGFNLTGLSGQTLVVEGSSNLIDWIGLQTNLLMNDTIYFSDAEATNFSFRFYRVRLQ